MRTREIVGEIERRGGRLVRQVGSHARYEAPYTREDGTPGRVATAVAMHPGDIPPGTLRKIEKDLEPAFGKDWLR
jgi:predicted RNA binding protein YcfA (HicA-like mRNA interferase family)